MAHDDRQFNNLQAAVRSFFSGPLYRDVALNWRGTGLHYMLLLLALTFFLVIVRYQVALSVYLKEEYRGALQNIPEFEIVNGEVSLEAAQPCLIRNDDTGKLIAVIDTSGQVSTLAQTDARFLLAKTRLYVRNDRGRYSDFGLERFKDRKFDADVIKRWVWVFHLFWPLVMYPTGLMVALALRTALAYLLAAAGAAAAPALGAALDYAALVRLAVVAQTPDILLGSAGEIAGISVPHGLALRLALTAVVFLFAIRANAGIVMRRPDSDWALGWLEKDKE